MILSLSKKLLQLVGFVQLFIVNYLLLPINVWAASSNISSIDNFIKSIITALTGIAGLIATAFFVLGGFKYITSSGNPHSLEHAKRTLIFSALGLAITIAAFVLSNIVTSLASSAFGS